MILLKRMSLGLLVTAMALVGSSARADLQYVAYGIDDNNNIRAVNVTTQTNTVVASTGLSGNSNGMAIDSTSRYLVFRNNESGSLRTYDLATNTLTTLTGTALPGSTASAAFYNGSYYYFQNNTSNLFKVDINFATSTITGVTNITSGATGIPSLGFGDIAIDSGGILYGSSSNQGFFTLNLNTLAYNEPAGGTNSTLQIALTADQGGLYAHNHDTGQWSTLTLGGVATTIPGFQTTPLRDVADRLVAVPEPSSIVLVGLGGVAVAGTLIRRKRASVA